MEENDILIERHISSYSLFFKDSDMEKSFQISHFKNTNIPLIAKILNFICAMLSVVYRTVAALSSIYPSLGFPNSGMIPELIMLFLLIIAFSVESLMICFNHSNKFRGFLITIMLPCVCITAAFLTQKSPYFGFAYF